MMKLLLKLKASPILLLTFNLRYLSKEMLNNCCFIVLVEYVIFIPGIGFTIFDLVQRERSQSRKLFQGKSRNKNLHCKFPLDDQTSCKTSSKTLREVYP